MAILGFWDLLLIKLSLIGLSIAYLRTIIQKFSHKADNTTPLTYSVEKAKHKTRLPLTRSIKKKLEQLRGDVLFSTEVKQELQRDWQ